MEGEGEVVADEAPLGTGMSLRGRMERSLEMGMVRVGRKLSEMKI